MTDKTPQSLDRLWEELPVGRAPIDSIVARGLAAKRRRRRLAGVGVTTAMALVLGGGVIAAQSLTGTEAPGGTRVADGAAGRLDVTVRVDDSGAQERGAALWEPETQRLIYASRTDYSSSCPPDGTATEPRPGAVALELTTAKTEQACTADGRPVLASITGLAVRPSEVRVTEDGTTRTVPVAVGQALPQTDAADPDGGRSPQPQLVEDERAPVPPDLDRLVESFVWYAVGGVDTFPHADWVSMSIGGEEVQSVDDFSVALRNREIWSICPADWDGYGASSCPVDLLGPVVQAGVNDAGLVYTAEYGEVTCAPARSGPLPEGRLVVLRPEPERRTCAGDFALALVADEQGRLRSVDLTLAAP